MTHPVLPMRLHQCRWPCRLHNQFRWPVHKCNGIVENSEILNKADIRNISHTIAVNANTLNKPGIQDMRFAAGRNIHRTDKTIVAYSTVSTGLRPLDCAAPIVPQHAVEQIYRADKTIIHDVAIFSVQYVDHAVIREIGVPYGNFVNEYIISKVAVGGY